MVAADGVLKTTTPDVAHRVEGPAVGVASHPVDGHDARMLQPPRDLGFEQKAGTPLRVVGVPLLDFLEGDLTAHLLVAGDEHLAQPAPGVRPKDAKANPDEVVVPAAVAPRYSPGGIECREGSTGAASMPKVLGIVLPSAPAASWPVKMPGLGHACQATMQIGVADLSKPIDDRAG